MPCGLWVSAVLQWVDRKPKSYMTKDFFISLNNQTLVQMFVIRMYIYVLGWLGINSQDVYIYIYIIYVLGMEGVNVYLFMKFSNNTNVYFNASEEYYIMILLSIHSLMYYLFSRTSLQKRQLDGAVHRTPLDFYQKGTTYILNYISVVRNFFSPLIAGNNFACGLNHDKKYCWHFYTVPKWRLFVVLLVIENIDMYKMFYYSIIWFS